MALQKFPSIKTKTLTANSAANLDAAVVTQVTALQANRAPSTAGGGDAGAGNYGVNLGSITVSGYQLVISTADAITYSCQLTWAQNDVVQ